MFQYYQFYLKYQLPVVDEDITFESCRMSFVNKSEKIPFSRAHQVVYGGTFEPRDEVLAKLDAALRSSEGPNQHRLMEVRKKFLWYTDAWQVSLIEKLKKGREVPSPPQGVAPVKQNEDSRVALYHCTERGCHFLFETLPKLQRHITNTHGKMWYCDMCYHIYATQGSLNRHRAANTQITANHKDPVYCGVKRSVHEKLVSDGYPLVEYMGSYIQVGKPQ